MKNSLRSTIPMKQFHNRKLLSRLFVFIVLCSLLCVFCLKMFSRQSKTSEEPFIPQVEQYANNQHESSKRVAHSFDDSDNNVIGQNVTKRENTLSNNTNDQFNDRNLKYRPKTSKIIYTTQVCHLIYYIVITEDLIKKTG